MRGCGGRRSGCSKQPAWYRDALTGLPAKYPAVRALLFFNAREDRTLTHQAVDWSIAGEPAIGEMMRGRLESGRWGPGYDAMTMNSRAPRISLLARLVFAAAIFFTSIGVLELAFIGYDVSTGGSLSKLRAPDLERGIRSWTVHHAMRPGFIDAEAKLNSFGLRSPEVAVPKPAGTIRVLLLGDSFTFGYKVNQSETFARRVEVQLRKELGLTSAEVVNAGVVSYGPLLEYLQYRHHLHVLEPDLVVLNFDMSDVKDHQAYSRQVARSSDGVPLFATEPSLGRRPGFMPELLSLQWFEQQLIDATWRYRSAAGDPRFVGDLDRYLWTLDDGPALETEALAAMGPIADLASLLQHHGVPLVLATYPQPWQVAADATPDPATRLRVGVEPGAVHLNDRPFRMLQQFALEQGVPFLNATQVFRQAADPSRLYLETDLHFSPLGHQLYADVLTRYIVEHQFTARRVRGGADQQIHD